MRHDGGQLPQRDAEEFEDLGGVAVTQLVAFGGVDLAKTVLVRDRVQDGIEPGHGIGQGSVEVEGCDVVFQVNNPMPSYMG